MLKLPRRLGGFVVVTFVASEVFQRQNPLSRAAKRLLTPTQEVRS